MSFWKKQDNVEEMLERYFDRCDQCFDRFEKAMTIFFAQGLSDDFEEGVEETHRSESMADEQRREIEYLLYGKALLPESRGDLLGLLETYDKLPNIAETVAFALSCQRVAIPDELKAKFEHLFKVNMEGFRLARKTVTTLMANPKATLSLTKEVELKESESDRLERDLLRDIFRREMDMGLKLLLKDVVLLFGEISDRCEEVADRSAITAIKRQL